MIIVDAIKRYGDPSNKEVTWPWARLIDETALSTYAYKNAPLLSMVLYALTHDSDDAAAWSAPSIDCMSVTSRGHVC